MLASVLSVIIALAIFFKFETHRFRALYCGIACAICLPVLTAVIYAVTLFVQSVGMDGFIRDSFALIGNALVAPFAQISGSEVLPTVVFPGWLMLAAILVTVIRLLATARANQTEPS